jgi:Sec-independent protein translocase protein TatA
MELFGVGPLELLFIIVIALIVMGPQDMAKTARKLGRFLNQLYKSETWRTIMEASRNLRTLPNRLAREAALEELDEVRKDLEGAGQSLRADLDASEARIREDLGAAAQRISTDFGPALEVGKERGSAKEGGESTSEDVPTAAETGSSLDDEQ